MAHVLLLEPNRLLARVYARGLEHAGHAVRTSTTAQQAIQLADEACPDVVVLELQLVAHSGIEFLYEFRSYADWQVVPVIVLSSVPPTEFTGSIHLLKDLLGVRAYHYKPYTNLATLIQAVAAALEPA